MVSFLGRGGFDFCCLRFYLLNVNTAANERRRASKSTADRPEKRHASHTRKQELCLCCTVMLSVEICHVFFDRLHGNLQKNAVRSCVDADHQQCRHARAFCLFQANRAFFGQIFLCQRHFARSHLCCHCFRNQYFLRSGCNHEMVCRDLCCFLQSLSGCHQSESFEHFLQLCTERILCTGKCRQKQPFGACRVWRILACRAAHDGDTR